MKPYYAHRATDNNPTSCTLTTFTEDPWFRVYAPQSVYVRAVAITSSVKNPSYLHHAVVKVGDQDPVLRDGNPKCYGPVPDIQAGKTVAFPCSIPLYGKYVSVYLYGTRKMSLCEMAVYGDRYFGKRTVVTK